MLKLFLLTGLVLPHLEQVIQLFQPVEYVSGMTLPSPWYLEKPPPYIPPTPPGSPTPSGQGYDPEKVVAGAWERLATLEGKYDLLRGLSKTRPDLQRDEKGRLQRIGFVFAVNATHEGCAPNGPPRAKDDSKPFLSVSVDCWHPHGPSQQPCGEWIHFSWQGEPYTLWVQVHGNKEEVVKAVRQKIEERLLDAPPSGTPPPPVSPRK